MCFRDPQHVAEIRCRLVPSAKRPQVHIVSVSHAWETMQHPDPLGDSFCLMQSWVAPAGFVSMFALCLCLFDPKKTLLTPVTLFQRHRTSTGAVGQDEPYVEQLVFHRLHATWRRFF